MVGASFTTFAANGLLVALSLHYTSRVYPIHYEWERLARIAALFTTVWLADALLTAGDLRLAIPLKMAWLMAFILGLRLLGVVGQSEMDYIGGVARRTGLRLRHALGVGLPEPGKM
jgi:hypothetical protein